MTFDNHSNDLKRLLAQAREAINSGTATKRKAADAALHDFIENSDNRKDGVDELDAVARTARNDLTLAELGDAVAAITNRTSDVAALVKRFSNQAAFNTSAASVLRLERVNAVVIATTSSVQSIKGLIEAVDDSTPDGKKIADAAIAAVDSLNKLWKLLPNV